jgi:hypothetical protein
MRQLGLSTPRSTRSYPFIHQSERSTTEPAFRLASRRDHLQEERAGVPTRSRERSSSGRKGETLKENAQYRAVFILHRHISGMVDCDFVIVA